MALCVHIFPLCGIPRQVNIRNYTNIILGVCKIVWWSNSFCIDFLFLTNIYIYIVLWTDCTALTSRNTGMCIFSLIYWLHINFVDAAIHTGTLVNGRWTGKCATYFLSAMVNIDYCIGLEPHRQRRRHFKCISLNANLWISYNVSL